MTKTKVIDSCIAVILALLGRVTGSAGYASVIAGSFMGALSGSGPGNTIATGSITVPAMKRSGFPPELAANIVSNASYMGNMIPPSSIIVAALVIGGESATAICTVIYKTIIPYIIKVSTIMILLGLVAMYLNGEMALTSNKKKPGKK